MSDALGQLVRVGLRNPVRVVVKVESKVGKGKAEGQDGRNIPTLCVATSWSDQLSLTLAAQAAKRLCRLLALRADRHALPHPPTRSLSLLRL